MFRNRTKVFVVWFVLLQIVMNITPGQCSERKAVRHNKEQRQSRKSSSRLFDLTVVGSVWRADGLGKQAIDLIEILMPTTKISYLSPGRVDPSELASVSLAVRKVLQTSGKKNRGRVLIYEDILTPLPCNPMILKDYWKRYGLPKKTNRQLRFAYTMFESTRIPKEWSYILNKFFDAAIVPDPFLVKVYKDSGVNIPVFIIPLGRDFSKFLNAPLKKVRHYPFVFANFSTCLPRKNLSTLVRSFAETFENSPDVELRLCWRYGDEGSRKEVFSEIKSRSLTNVRVEERAVNDDVYAQRFQDVDCYVSPSTGEGFSIQPRESMALGIPVIVTDNTAQSTICRSGIVKAVPSTIRIPALTFPKQYGEQFQCQTKDLGGALQEMYERYDEYLAKSAQAREWARQYHYQNMASLYRGLIKPKKILLGLENKILANGVVVTNSKKLVSKYKKIFKHAHKK